MTIKRILVPLCRQELDEPALEAGVSVAQKVNAHLEGVYIRDSTANSVKFSSSHLDVRHYSELVSRLQNQSRQDAIAARAAFDEFVTSRNLPLSGDRLEPNIATASWEEWTGDPGEMVAIHGGAFDLIVTSFPTPGPAAMQSSIRETAIFSTACPVLLASEKQFAGLGQSVLIAWNRGIQSRRAVAAALPFLKRADSVLIVNVSTGAKQGPEPEEIACTLAWHGVKADVRRVLPDRRNVGEILVEEARSTGADLLVMGAYSEHRLRERLMGGVTKVILANADFPVLMVR